MTAAVALGPALRALRSLGFRKVYTGGQGRSYDGELRCKAGTVPVRLEITDWDFLSYPTIRLRERPAFLPRVLPHVSAAGVLCYFADGAVVLDRFRPDIALAQCLAQARDVLDRLSTDPNFYAAEFRGEFLVHWSITDGAPALLSLIGEHPADVTRMRWYEVGIPPMRRYFVSADLDEVTRYCAAAGWPPPSPMIDGVVLQSQRQPAVPTNGLPKTLSEMFAWLRSWDPAVYSALQDHLLEVKLVKRRQREFLFGSPAGWFGFGLTLDALAAKGFQRGTAFRQYLHRHSQSLRVDRRVFLEAGPTHVHQRNLMRLGSTSLAGRRVILIGCGAIGGFVAATLVRLGAGSAGGSLTCYDAGQLEPDNLGRHWLGHESVFRNKAEAVAARLRSEFPFARVDGKASHVDSATAQEADVVINATGDQAFAEALNAHHVARGATPPILHLWIVGNGEAAQGLWVDATRGACYRCLRHNNDAQYGELRFQLLKSEPVRAFVGCHAFAPYSATAPLTAAALAGDFVMDWLGGDVSPRFRTRAHERADIYKIKNQDVARLRGCPACDK